eukprot:349770-Chlamydomonas_euryale.AAC.7
MEQLNVLEASMKMQHSILRIPCNIDTCSVKGRRTVRTPRSEHDLVHCHKGTISSRAQRRWKYSFVEHSPSSADRSNCPPTRAVGAPIGQHPEAAQATEGQRDFSRAATLQLQTANAVPRAAGGSRLSERCG